MDQACLDGPAVTIVTGTGPCSNAGIYGPKPGCSLGPILYVETCKTQIKNDPLNPINGNTAVDYPPAPKPCNSVSYWCEGEHESALLYCDNCIADKNAAVTINGVLGTTAALAICGNCSDGQLLEFTDSVTIQIDLTEERLGDAILLTGTDLCTTGDQITVFLDDELAELESHSSNPVIIDPMCTHCAGDQQCKPIAIYPPALTKARQLRLIIEAPGTHFINRLFWGQCCDCLLYTSPSPRDQRGSRMPSSA